MSWCLQSVVGEMDVASSAGGGAQEEQEAVGCMPSRVKHGAGTERGRDEFSKPSLFLLLVDCADVS